MEEDPPSHKEKRPQGAQRKGRLGVDIPHQLATLAGQGGYRVVQACLEHSVDEEHARQQGRKVQQPTEESYLTWEGGHVWVLGAQERGKKSPI
jgi:hypothetical protein